jgi:hypothetical protein
MTAIVYSGSKDSFWKITHQEKVIAECTIAGLNPSFNDEEQILSLLNKETTLINYAEQIKKIYVFAAGASSDLAQNSLGNIIGNFFKNSKITVKDDLYGASIAACGNEKGIVCILGSGSNCAFFDGKNPVKNNFGLGYILGDEGSANYLGKLLLKNYLQNNLPEDLRKLLEEKYHIDRTIILEKVYRKPNVQNYLSSFLDFFITYRTHAYIINLIDTVFDNFIKIYLKPIQEQYPNEKIHFVGSVAGLFENRLLLKAAQHQFSITSIIKEPIKNITNYYAN